MKPTYLSLDTKCDRREIWHLLHRRPPRARYDYLVQCCEAVKDGLGNGLFPLPSMLDTVAQAMRCDRADERLTNSVYADILALAANRNLDLVAVALDLERIARGRPGAQPAALRASRAADARSAVLRAV